MKTFEVEIITPEETVFKDKVYSLIVPAYEGYLGVMAGHAPFICILSRGKITLRLEKGEHLFFISGGVMETTPFKTTILAEAIMYE